MLSVALTGNIASGKSLVADHFRRWGATVIEADALVRELQEPGTPVLKAMTERFGSGILREDGSLDRARLRALVFSYPTARADLEAIVHPAVELRRVALLEEARRQGDRIVVSDIPLLFEAHDPAGFDAVVLVDAPEPVRQERLVRYRQLDPTIAGNMIAAQMPAAAKRERSDFVIDNDGTLEDLERQAAEVWRALLDRA